MIGIIIAGGFGTRMRPLTYTRPKHLLPLANRPFLEYQVALLRGHGISDVVLATGYKAYQIEDHFGDGERFGVRMRYALEPHPLGTAGAIGHAAQLAPGQAAVVLNGDILTDFDLSELVAYHRSHRACATVALRPAPRPHGFGIIACAPDGRMSAWHEPSDEAKRRALQSPPGTGSDLINAGIYVLNSDVLAGIPSGRPVSIERETYPQLLSVGAPVYGFEPAGFWMDLGSPSAYLAASAAVLRGEVRTTVPVTRVAADADIAPDASVDEETSVGQRCRVGAGARLRQCIILDGVTVGAAADLTELIVDEGAEVGSEVRSRPGVVLSAGSHVGRGSTL